MKKKTYDVGLSNRDCIFDGADGFETPEDALDWADGRGGEYVIQLSNSDGVYLNVSANDTSRGMQYHIFNICEWRRISRKEIIEYIR